MKLCISYFDSQRVGEGTLGIKIPGFDPTRGHDFFPFLIYVIRCDPK